MGYTQEQLQQLKLKPGDIMLFSCNSIGGTTVQLACNSDWSHVGMIVAGENGSLELFESSLNYGRVIGVQITPLHESLNQTFILDNAQKIAIRRLKQPLSPAQSNALQKFIKQQLGKMYETNLLEFVKAGIQGPSTTDEAKAEILRRILPNSFKELLADKSGFARFISVSMKMALRNDLAKEDLSTLFCSELVAAALKDASLMPREFEANSFAPCDFSATDSRDAEFRGDDIFLAEELLPPPVTPISGMTVVFDMAKSAGGKLADEAKSEVDEIAAAAAQASNVAAPLSTVSSAAVLLAPEKKKGCCKIS